MNTTLKGLYIMTNGALFLKYNDGSRHENLPM